MPDHARFHKMLLARLDLLDGRLHEIETELDSHQSKDWEELAVEREGDEVLERLGVAGQLEMTQIRSALARIEAGEYGYCLKCGDAISEERLELVPHAPLCKTCARAAA